MIEPKGLNIDKAFTVSGVKDIGDYTYVLLIDFAGLTLIKRVKSDSTEIKYAKRGEQSIADFWSDPTLPTYKYINEI